MQGTKRHLSALWLLPLALAAILLVGCVREVRAVGGKENWTLATIPVPFTGQSKMGNIGAEEYRYFRYPSEAVALIDKDRVSEDGREIAGVRYDWGGPVHFYQFLKRIVIYVGDDEEAMKLIERTFGPQFVGHNGR